MARVLALWVLGVGVSVPAGRTCNIPVFRYALEHWAPASYDVVAFHRGPIADEGRAALAALRQSGANLEIDRIDVEEPMAPRRKAILEKAKLAPPFLVALYPGTEQIAWAGPLEEKAARSLVESPGRTEVSRRLLEGDSAVWVFLDSGDSAKDDSARARLEGELRRLEQSLSLPAHSADDPPLLSEISLRISFSVYRMSRKDPKEAAFVQTLLNSDTGLGGPVAVPIYGRGRALWALGDRGINAEMITEAGTFLTGACSCEAKELNPGVDLLFSTDWDSALSAVPAPAPLPTPVLRRPPPEPESTSKPSEATQSFLWGALLASGLAVALTGRRLLGALKARN